jgi:MoCo/4Fe-4S cofactor protein with predicted Tat translocation signal
LNSPKPPTPSPQYWRSLDEREELTKGAPDPGEFAPGADLPPAGLSRRTFMGLLGATAALATTAACDRKSKQLAVPYTKRPEAGVPGVADYYASSFLEGPRSFSVLV